MMHTNVDSDSDDDVCWGPVTLGEIKRDFKHSIGLSAINKRRTIGFNSPPRIKLEPEQSISPDIDILKTDLSKLSMNSHYFTPDETAASMKYCTPNETATSFKSSKDFITRVEHILNDSQAESFVTACNTSQIVETNPNNLLSPVEHYNPLSLTHIAETASPSCVLDNFNVTLENSCCEELGLTHTLRDIIKNLENDLEPQEVVELSDDSVIDISSSEENGSFIKQEIECSRYEGTQSKYEDISEVNILEDSNISRDLNELEHLGSNQSNLVTEENNFCEKLTEENIGELKSSNEENGQLDESMPLFQNKSICGDKNNLNATNKSVSTLISDDDDLSDDSFQLNISAEAVPTTNFELPKTLNFPNNSISHLNNLCTKSPLAQKIITQNLVRDYLDVDSSQEMDNEHYKLDTLHELTCENDSDLQTAQSESDFQDCKQSISTCNSPVLFRTCNSAAASPANDSTSDGSFAFNDTLEEIERALKHGLDYTMSESEDKVEDKPVVTPVKSFVSRLRPPTQIKITAAAPKTAIPGFKKPPIKSPAIKASPLSKNMFGHIQSPIAYYIKSTTTPLVQNMHSSPCLKPQKLKLSAEKKPGKENFRIPDLVYKPGKRVVVGSEPKVKLPKVIENLTPGSRGVIKHDGRIGVARPSHIIKQKLVDGNLTMNNSNNDSMLDSPHDISMVVSKRAYIK